METDDNLFATPRKLAIRGALARSLSAVATSSPLQERMAETLNLAKDLGRRGGEIGVGWQIGRVGAGVWAEEVANGEEMADVAGHEKPTTLTPSRAKWRNATAVLVMPTKGNKRMVMGTPRRPRHRQAAPFGPVGFAAASALEQILGAVAGLGGRMEEREIALQGRMMEGMAALAANADARAARMMAEVERLEVGLQADAEEKEARLMAKLLVVDAMEQELAGKAKWEVKQWEDLAGLMRLRREDIKEVKQAVDTIGAELAERGTTRPPRIPLAPPPGAVEGVVTTMIVTVSAPQEDAIEEWSDMEGVEHEGLFASLHAPELGTSSAPEPAASAKKEEEEKK